jgi:hypothetical protein
MPFIVRSAEGREFVTALAHTKVEKRSSMTGTRFWAVIGLALLLSCSAFASSVTTFSFVQHGNGSMSNTATFTAGSYSLTAYGFRDGNHTDDLFFKNGSGDENGLGLLHGYSNHEIGGTAFIEFSTSGIVGKHLEDFLSVGSVQKGESWKIYGSNVLGQRGILLLSGVSEGEINITQFAKEYKYLSLGAGSKDVLFGDVKVISTVPELGTITLFGTGLLGMAAMIRRKLNRYPTGTAKG